MSEIRKSGYAIRLALIVAASMAANGPVCEAAAVTFDEIRENVRRNELLYANLDVRLVHAYRTNEKYLPKFDGMVAVRSKDTEVHYVHQGEKFRLAKVGGLVTSDDKQMDEGKIRVFNGKETRFLKGRIGNIVNGASKDTDTILAHMLFLGYLYPNVNLSTYMAGHEAMLADPHYKWDESLVLENTYQGEATWNGLKCHRVWITSKIKPDGILSNRWELWLAEERNFIPARILSYRFRASHDVPISESVVTEWLELDPGIWFPKAAHHTSYNSGTLKLPEREIGWEQDFQIEHASLHPQYPDEFFENLEFPDGTAVYHIENRKVIKSYRKGAPEEAGEGAAVPWWKNSFVLLNVAGAMAFVTFVGARRLRRQSRAAAVPGR